MHYGTFAKSISAGVAVPVELTAPALLETVFGIGGRYVADWLQKEPVVEPDIYIQRSELQGVNIGPRPASMDDLDVVKTMIALARALS